MHSILLAVALLIQNPLPALPRTGTVTGILRTSLGVPLEGVRVAVTPADVAVADDLLESIALTDKDGRYRLESVSPGRYYIVVGRGLSRNYHPGVSEPERATVISVTSSATITVPDLVFARVKVAGKVIDWATGMGRRIEKLQICCEQTLTQTSSYYVTAVGTAFTASVRDDGTFVFDGVPSGKFTIQAFDPGIIATGQTLAVNDVDVSGVEVKVSSGVQIQGNVFDRLGIPVPGVVARANPRPANTAFSIAPNALAPAGGPSSVVFSALGLNVSTITTEVLQAGLLRSVKVEFVPVDSDGRFSINRLVPGVYLLEVNAPGRNLIEREIEVGPSGVANLRVEVPFTRLLGRVVAGGSEPLPKIEGSIRLIPSAPGAQILYIFPEADGRFSPLLAPGEYHLSTENLGRRVQSVMDGNKDLTAEPLVFDGIRKPEIVVTLEP